jgi:flagellin-like hook-associated protein FlgL
MSRRRRVYMVIKHCMEAMNANRQLDMTIESSDKTTRKLSSGYKINIAADDAAGLAISEKMRKQIRGLTQASTNAEDGISMVQVADGALEEVQSMLQRMNELCVQAANGTYSDTDRAYIQDEISQLTTEIDRVSETTKFNEIYLLNGSIGNMYRTAANMTEDKRKLQEYIAEDILAEQERNNNSYTVLNGENTGQVVTQAEVDNTEGLKIIYYDTADASSVSVSRKLVTKDPPDDTKYNNLKNILETQIVPQAVTQLLNAYSPTFDAIKDVNIGIGLNLGNNNSPNLSSSTLAYVEVQSYTSDGSTMIPNQLDYQLTVNLDTLTFQSDGTLTADSRNKLEVTIVHEMMHAFMDEVLTNGMIGIVDGTLARNDAYPKWFKEGMAQTAAGAYYNENDWINGGMNITTSTSETQIESILNKYKLGNNDNTSVYGTGYLACMYLGYLAGGAANVDDTTIKSGLNKILSSLYSGTSLNDVVKKYTGYSLTAFQNNFAKNASSFVKDLTNVVGNNTGGLVGFNKSDDILPNTTLSNVSLFQLYPDALRVQNIYPTNYPVLTGGSKTNTKSGIVIDVGDISISAIGRGINRSGPLRLQVGADATSNNKITIFINAINAKTLGLLDVSVKDQDSSRYSIERVALALARVSEQRSELGSYQNRLEHTIKNLDNVVENTTSAESIIRDTDMATEMVKYANTNILMQAGQSMLTQATQTNVGVLSLIS